MNFPEVNTDLTEWEQLQLASQPQSNFKLDWAEYGAHDFGDTFLPKADQLVNDRLRIYDGAQLFRGSNLQDSNLLMIAEKTPFDLFIYTYPEEADIQNNLSRVKASSNDICVFINMDTSKQLHITFRFGKKFKKFLEDYFQKEGKKGNVSDIEQKTFDTNKVSLENHFGKIANHQVALLYILSFLDVHITSEFDDGSIRIKLLAKENKERIDTIVPFGVKSYSKDQNEANKKKPENQSLRFEIQLLETGIESLQFDIMNDKDVYSSYTSGLMDLKGKSVDDLKKLKKGTYYFEWDGFDLNGIYDSVALSEGKFKLRINTVNTGISKSTDSKEFKFKPDEFDWIDVKIDRNAKRADFHLRVELEDGGEIGTQADCDNANNCPWDPIPAIAISNENKSPIQTRTQSYNDLRDAALLGISKFWGRNSTNIGASVTLGKEQYQVYVTAEVAEKGLKAPKIIYYTNKKKEQRSRNFFLSRILFYNVGYFYDSHWEKYYGYTNPEAQRRYNNKGWYYVNENILDFEMTSAHEIGHEILKAYGGARYSFSHKDSSTIITQADKGEKLPTKGEIDLMKYYDTYYVIPRTVAAEQDVLGLFWLTKLNVK